MRRLETALHDELDDNCAVATACCGKCVEDLWVLVCARAEMRAFLSVSERGIKNSRPRIGVATVDAGS